MQTRERDYLIIWRVVSDGDFFQQTFLGQQSASRAVASWRRLWARHESTCVVFKIEQVYEEASAGTDPQE